MILFSIYFSLTERLDSMSGSTRCLSLTLCGVPMSPSQINTAVYHSAHQIVNGLRHRVKKTCLSSVKSPIVSDKCGALSMGPPLQQRLNFWYILAWPVVTSLL